VGKRDGKGRGGGVRGGEGKEGEGPGPQIFWPRTAPWPRFKKSIKNAAKTNKYILAIANEPARRNRAADRA